MMDPNEHSPRKKLGILAPHSLPPNLVGVLMNLAWLLEEDIDLHLITGRKDSLPSSITNAYTLCRVSRSSVDLGGLGFAVKALDAYLGEDRPDLLMNAGQPFPLGVAVVVKGLRFGIPTLLRITGNYLDEGRLQKGWGRVKARLMHRHILHFVYRQASLAVPVGRRLAKKMVQCGFEADAVVPQPQPFDPGPFTPLSEQEKKKCKAELGLCPGRNVVLFVGRLSWKKGADRVHKIAQRVLKRSSAFQFCLLGEGPYREIFQQFEAKDVCCPGRISRENVHRYFQVADLLLHPTRSDALPNVILEALASETPVVASPVGEIPDYVSMVTNDISEYVEYVVSKNWEKDSMSKSFKKPKQKQSYIDIINKAINLHGSEK